MILDILCQRFNFICRFDIGMLQPQTSKPYKIMGVITLFTTLDDHRVPCLICWDIIFSSFSIDFYCTITPAYLTRSNNTKISPLALLARSDSVPLFTIVRGWHPKKPFIFGWVTRGSPWRVGYFTSWAWEVVS